MKKIKALYKRKEWAEIIMIPKGVIAVVIKEDGKHQFWTRERVDAVIKFHKV